MVSVWPLWEINMQVDNLALDIWAYYTGSPALSIDFRLVLQPTTTMNKYGMSSENWIIQTCPLSLRLQISYFTCSWTCRSKIVYPTITITGHRSALSSLMTFRWLNISRIPGRNILVIYFSVEFSSTNRETPWWDLSRDILFSPRTSVYYLIWM